VTYGFVFGILGLVADGAQRPARSFVPSFYALLGCMPGLCGSSKMQPMMKAAMTAEAIGRLNARPP
jgi:hypothetical protein